MFQSHQPISRTYLIHFPIDTRSHYRCLISETKVLNVINALFCLRIMTNQSPPFYCIINLRSMKAQCSHIASCNNRLSIFLYTKGMSSIINDFQAISVCYLLNTIHVTRLPIYMYRHYCCCFRSYCSLYLFRIHISCHRINIDKHRFNSIPPKRMRSRHETIRCSYNLPRNTHRLQSAYQR